MFPRIEKEKTLEWVEGVPGYAHAPQTMQTSDVYVTTFITRPARLHAKPRITDLINKEKGRKWYPYLGSDSSVNEDKVIDKDPIAAVTSVNSCSSHCKATANRQSSSTSTSTSTSSSHHDNNGSIHHDNQGSCDSESRDYLEDEELELGFNTGVAAVRLTRRDQERPVRFWSAPFRNRRETHENTTHGDGAIGNAAEKEILRSKRNQVTAIYNDERSTRDVPLSRGHGPPAPPGSFSDVHAIHSTNDLRDLHDFHDLGNPQCPTPPKTPVPPPFLPQRCTARPDSLASRRLSAVPSMFASRSSSSSTLPKPGMMAGSAGSTFSSRSYIKHTVQSRIKAYDINSKVKRKSKQPRARRRRSRRAYSEETAELPNKPVSNAAAVATKISGESKHKQKSDNKTKNNVENPKLSDDKSKSSLNKPRTSGNKQNLSADSANATVLAEVSSRIQKLKLSTKNTHKVTSVINKFDRSTSGECFSPICSARDGGFTSAAIRNTSNQSEFLNMDDFVEKNRPRRKKYVKKKQRKPADTLPTRGVPYLYSHRSQMDNDIQQEFTNGYPTMATMRDWDTAVGRRSRKVNRFI